MMATMSSRLAQHYARLGLTPGNATHADVTAAYRALALRHHPDVGGSASAFAELQAARDALLTAPQGAGGELGSLRMYRYRGNSECASDKWGLLGAVVFPTALGMLVGLRLLYVDNGNVTDGRGVRAGGNSRVRLADLRRVGNNESAVPANSAAEEADGRRAIVVPSSNAASLRSYAAHRAPETERPRDGAAVDDRGAT